MDLLKERILRDARVIGDDIVKVGSFVNHMVDPVLMSLAGKEFARAFRGEGITKVLTVETSGIAIASFVALELGVPFIFAKKYSARNLDSDVYEAEIFSYTKNSGIIIRVSKDYLSRGDKVLIIDDFLANGQALLGLIKICTLAGAKVSGCGVLIEKAFQPGGEFIRSRGVRLESLAIISSIKNGDIIFK